MTVTLIVLGAFVLVVLAVAGAALVRAWLGGPG